MHFTGRKKPNRTKQTKHEWIFRRKASPAAARKEKQVFYSRLFHVYDSGASAKTMQIICQMKKIYTERWMWGLKHTQQLKKHSIKIQSIFITVRECRMPFNVSKKVLWQLVCICMQTAIVRCINVVLQKNYAQSAYMKPCDWNMQIYPGKLREKFTLHFLSCIFWSFWCIFEIHSLDTLNNYLHCSA